MRRRVFAGPPITRSIVDDVGKDPVYFLFYDLMICIP